MRRGQKKSDTPGLIRKSSGIYWVVINIPKDVQGILGKTKHHQSTGTTDKHRAVEVWGAINAEWRQKIRDARSGRMRRLSDDQLSFVANAMLEDRQSWDVDAFSKEGLTGIKRWIEITLEETAELVREHLYDNGGSEGEMAVHEVIRIDDMTESDRDALATLILDRYVRSLEFRSKAARSATNTLTRKAAALRAENKGRIGDTKVRLMDVFPIWSSTQRLQQTIEEGRRACEAFIRVNGDLGVTEFTKQHGNAFADHLGSQRDKNGRPLAAATHAKKIGAVRAVFFVAMDRNADLAINPLSRVRVPGASRVRHRRRGFGPRNEGWSLTELQKLFRSRVYSRRHRSLGCGGEAAYWLPILGIYTGARQSELAQLDLADVKVIKGVPVLHITNESDEPPESYREKRLKTGEIARRYVPVHSEVIRLGFLEYVKSVPKGGKLFQALRPGAHGKWGEMFSKWFGRYRRLHAGVTRRWADYHALRHTFITACRAASIPTADHEYLTAHVSSNVGGTYGTWNVPYLKQQIEKIQYSEGDLVMLKIPRWEVGRS